MAGYDVQVIDHYPQQLHCGICTLIIHNAMNGCSKHVFCKACIEKYVEKNDGNEKCPGGCGIAINPKKLEPNEFVDRLVNTLSCKCSNDCCEWQGDLLDLIQDHQRNCNYNLQSCDNEGCEVKYYKIDIVQHDEVCRYKMIQCAYCQTKRRRIDKEQHVVECLDEQINCSYYDIGCMKKVCRRDMGSHEETYQLEHTKLIHQNLITCKKELSTSQNEIAILKQENAAIKEENVVMKKESKLLTNKFDELEIKLETTSKRGQAFGKENFDSVRDLCGNVSLINNNEVLVVKCSKTVDELSKCYKTNNFDCVTDQFHFSHNKTIMADLFVKTLYHWYECEEDQYYKFIFPLDMNNITNFEVIIPDKFKVKILNRQITVENMRSQLCDTCNLYVEKNKKKLFHRKKFHLHNMNSCGKCSTSFAHGYACLDFLWEK